MAQANVSCKKEEAMNMITSNFDEQPSVMGREDNGSRWIPEDHQCKHFSENHCHPSSTTMDLHLDTKIRLCSPPMNNLLGGQQQFPSSFFKGWTESIMFDEAASASISSVKCEYPETIVPDQALMSTTASFHPLKNKDSIKHETAQADHSVSNCNDQIGNADHKVVGRRHGSKNLGAERRRRKKINDGLYTLRSLVPNITKLDKASILGDAIDFVKELQAQVKDLQDELEEPSSSGVKNNSNNVQLEEPNQNWVSHCVDHCDHEECLNGSKMGIIDCGAICASNGENSDPSKLSQDTAIVYEDDHDKAQQMEIQVKVAQIDGNEFCIEVLCKHKPHGFVRLMEAIDSLGLVVTNANITTLRGLVLNVFNVERKDNVMVEAEHVRDLLLKLMCNPIGR